MFKLHSVKINGFWQRFSAECNFYSDVNIIIGKNGTGKTTFMNILQAVLTVDIDEMLNNEFDSIEIILKNEGKQRTVKAARVEEKFSAVPLMEYQISSKKYSLPLLSPDDRRASPLRRRRAVEGIEEIRRQLSQFVSLSTLSVYRLRSGEDLEIRDKFGLKIINPVDYRLSQLLQKLALYQLELSQMAQNISIELQKEVLASILYDKDDSDRASIGLTFDKEKERSNLTSAYQQLNALDANIRRKINIHVDAIDKTIENLKSAENKKNGYREIDFRSIESLRQTQKIIRLSLKSKEKTVQLFSPINSFISILKEFITDKTFEFNAGELIVKSSYGSISNASLSSGEKQLLILFIETLLQKEQPYIFITDEPELSLHIAWQRKIIPAIKSLNPNAQIIAATHSPEVAAKYKGAIFDMEKLVHE